MKFTKRKVLDYKVIKAMVNKGVTSGSTAGVTLAKEEKHYEGCGRKGKYSYNLHLYVTWGGLRLSGSCTPTVLSLCLGLFMDISLLDHKGLNRISMCVS